MLRLIRLLQTIFSLYSGREWNKKIVEEECEEEVERRMKDIQEQEWREKLENLSSAKKIKIIIGEEKNIYKKAWVKETKKGLETLIRFRIESETKDAKEKGRRKSMQSVQRGTRRYRTCFRKM